MVRAGVVAHPSEWAWSGYNEIQRPRERYALIDRTGLKDLLGINDDSVLSEHHRQWIDDALKKDFHQRESRWTESVAVGSKAFIEQTRDQLGFRAKGRSVEGLDEVCALREANKDYDFAGKNSTLRSENTYSWNDTL
jgi:putative transposase